MNVGVFHTCWLHMSTGKPDSCFRQQNRQPYGQSCGHLWSPEDLRELAYIYWQKGATPRKRESWRRQKKTRSMMLRDPAHTTHTHIHTHNVIKGKEAKEESTALWLENSESAVLSLDTQSHTACWTHTRVHTHTGLRSPPQSRVLKCSINILYTRVPPVSPGTPLKCKEKKKTLSNNIRASRGRKRTHQFKRQCRQKIRLIFIMSRGIYIH